jgi:hypothetical protein|tara:strand:+ start:319 stop:492 length:174 start_codon:yes stop_codon:yes gene_type:complete
MDTKSITFVPLRRDFPENVQDVIAQFIFKQFEERNIRPEHYIHWSINVEYSEGNDEN